MKFTRRIVPLALVIVAVVLVINSSPTSTAPKQPPPDAATDGNAETGESFGALNDGTESIGAAPDASEPDGPVFDEAGDGPFDLSPQYEPDDRRRYLAIVRTEAEMRNDMGEPSTPQRSQLYIVCTIETVSRDETGTELTLTYDRIRSSTNAPNLSLNTDTRLDIDKPVNTIPGSYRRIIGVPVTIRLDAEGAIVSAQSELSDYGAEKDMFALARYMLLRDGIMYYLGPVFMHREAQESVHVYEPWTRYLEPYVGPLLKRWLETEHTLLSVEGDVANLTYTGFVQTADEEADFPDPEQTPLEPNLEGSYRWSIGDGSLIEADTVERFDRVTELRNQRGTVDASGEIKASIRRVNETFTLDELLNDLADIGRAEGPRPEGSANIDQLAARAAARADQPAIGVAGVTKDGIAAFGIRGIRNSDTRENIRTDDLFNVGFVTTNMVGTAIGAMVDAGVLRWDMTLPDALASAAHEGYRDVTLEMFLANRGGVVGFNQSIDPEYETLPDLVGEARDQRLDALRVILANPPAYEPGTETRTSAASVAVAVAIAEQATGRRWRDLFHEYLLGPSGMRSPRFGWPSTNTNPDMNRGHLRPTDRPVPIGVDDVSPFDPIRRPATGLSMTLEDLAKYTAHELDALAGESDLLSKETAERLHTAQDGQRSVNWQHGTLQSGRRIQWNRTIAGGFSTVVILMPELNIGACAVSNAGDGADACVTLAMQVLLQDQRMQAGQPPQGPLPEAN